MKQSFHINNKLKEVISNIIYDIKNYNNIISKYMDFDRCSNSDYCESRSTIMRQSFLIYRTMESFSYFNEINSDSLNLSMNFGSINDVINNVLDDIINLFNAKRIKFTLEKKDINEYIIMMDMEKIKNAILNIFSFIYNIIKINSSININYNLINYDEDEEFLLMNGINKINENDEKKLELSKECIDISITFECDKIPDDIKRKLFKTPLISYENIHSNNLYLYTSYKIIEKHYGNVWIESLDNREKINIVFPIKNKL